MTDRPLRPSPQRIAAALGLLLLYVFVSVWMVRRGQWSVVGGVVFVMSGVLLGLGVALTTRRGAQRAATPPSRRQ